jgi:hypothetical protein
MSCTNAFSHDGVHNCETQQGCAFRRVGIFFASFAWKDDRRNMEDIARKITTSLIKCAKIIKHVENEKHHEG